MVIFVDDSARKTQKDFGQALSISVERLQRRSKIQSEARTAVFIDGSMRKDHKLIIDYV